MAIVAEYSIDKISIIITDIRAALRMSILDIADSKSGNEIGKVKSISSVSGSVKSEDNTDTIRLIGRARKFSACTATRGEIKDIE